MNICLRAYVCVKSQTLCVLVDVFDRGEAFSKDGAESYTEKRNTGDDR